MNRKAILLTVAIWVSASSGAAFAGSEHAFGRSAGDCGGRWLLPDTGQEVHYSTAPGDDSDYQPAAVQPRFTVLNPVGVSSVTVDGVTGLMWITSTADAGINGTMNWDPALTACESLNYANFTDWRMPDIKELLSIADYGTYAPAIDAAYFLDTKNSVYWASTTVSALTTSAWSVNFNYGTALSSVKTNPAYLRCVRGGQ